MNRSPIITSVLVLLLAGPDILWADPPQPATEHMELLIPAMPIGSALNEFGRQTGLHIVMDAEVARNLRSKSVEGSFSVEGALKRMLAETGLRYEYLDLRTIAIRRELPGMQRSLPPRDGGNAASRDGAEIQLSRIEVTRPQAAHDGREDVAADDEKSSSGRQGRESGEVVVTGSRIARAASQLAANVIVIDAEALRATGESTLEKALRQLPQNMLGSTEVAAAAPIGGMAFNGALNITAASSINLRGLGSESTLVLIDGRRIGKSGVFGGVSDITGIPLSSVERVEIMLDGASSVYGSDAVGGVVNIILRKEYEGAEVGYEYGRPQEGGFDEHILTASGGFSWSRGRLHGTFEHFIGSNLDATERSARIASNLNDNPGGILSDSGLFYTYNGQNYTAAGLAAIGLSSASAGVQTVFYTQVPSGQNGIGLSVNDFAPRAMLQLGPGFNEDPPAGVSLIPGSQRDSLQFGFNQEFGSAAYPVTLSGNLYYSDRKTYAGNGVFRADFGLEADDPSNPFGKSVVVYWLVPALGVTHFDTDQQVARASLSLDGHMGANWRWNAAVGRSRDEINSLHVNGPDFGALFFADLNILAGDLTAANPPAELAALAADPTDVIAINEESVAELSFNGVLFNMPGGQAHLAIGAEYREESLQSMSELVSITQSGQSNGSLVQGAYASEASREQESLFAELLLPVVGAGNAVAGVRRLMLTGSGRYDSYDTYGSSSTWSAGFVWDPLEQLRIKANRSTSFVVPTPREGLATTDVFSYAPFGGLRVSLVDASGMRTGAFDFIGEVIIGGNPDLRPESATSWSAGLEFRPGLIDGMMLGATWHETRYADRISVAPRILYIDGTDYVSIYPNLTRGENGLLTWDARAINAASVDISGIDYLLRYDVRTRFGQFAVTGNIGYTHKYQEQTFANSSIVNRVGHYDSPGSYVYTIVPKYRYNAAFGWYRGGASLNLDLHTASDVSVTFRIVGRNLLTTSSTPATANLSLSYDWDEAQLPATSTWLQGMRISLRVLNVLDEQPQTRQVVLETGETFQPWYNANYADPRGRMFYVGLTKRF